MKEIEAIRAALASIVKTTPGLSSAEIADRFPEVKRKTISDTLYSLTVWKVAYSVKKSALRTNGHACPMNFWYPGKAPVTINHMTNGRPRGKKGVKNAH